jgi:outer membrane protein assembly factor BamD
MRSIAVIFFIGYLAIVSGCGPVDSYFLPPPEDTAQEILEAGRSAMEEGKHKRAARYFSSLKERYPFSPFAVEAELRLGDALYLAGDYSEAVDAYKEFETLHPGHEAIPYVLLQIGEANRKRFKSIDLPQEHVQEALEYYTRVIETYPEAGLNEDALEGIEACRRYIAEHEIFVADFYWRTDRYGAAFQRYTSIAQNFRDLRDVHQYALRRAEASYFRHQRTVTETRRREKEGSWKDYFAWF